MGRQGSAYLPVDAAVASLHARGGAATRGASRAFITYDQLLAERAEAVYGKGDATLSQQIPAFHRKKGGVPPFFALARALSVLA